jgi:hypothetical protein
MSPRRIQASVALAFLLLLSVTAYAQMWRRPAPNANRYWGKYEYEMQDPVDDPADALVPGEFVFGRLRYRSENDGRGYARWGIDASKGDRLFLATIRRLTRIHTRSMEEIIDVESDDIFNWPFLFAVSAGDWDLTPSHAARLKQYLDRGGFLLVDDFHGDRDWAGFMSGMSQIYPGARIEELEDSDPIFNVVYNLKDRVQIPGANVVHGRGYEKDGVVPHWRGLFDEKGRIIVAICFNMDVGDGWEFADVPDYPEKFSGQAMRLGINYVMYSMTH